MISCFSAMCMYNNEPWEQGHVSPNYNSLNIYIANLLTLLVGPVQHICRAALSNSAPFIHFTGPWVAITLLYLRGGKQITPER